MRFSQTAVGDRWLSHALKDSGERVLGVEDSGHLVLSGPNPNGGRVLVGDGVASMLVVLCAMLLVMLISTAVLLGLVTWLGQEYEEQLAND